MSVNNPPGHTNYYTMRLLCWKLEFDSTWLPLKLTSKDNMGLGKMTRGDISSAFRLNLKKKGNTTSIILHFLIGTITQQNPKSKLNAQQKLQTTN